MIGVGTGFRDVVHDPTKIASILGTEIRNDLKFCNAVLVAKKDVWSTYRVVIVVLAIQLEIIGTRSLTVYG
jgi:hypothetical protein